MSSTVASTQWSQVLAARDGTNSEARAALEFLIQTYWPPLYAFIRHHGYGPEESRDLTQAFFTHLLETDFLASVDPQKGRFRSFLLVSLRNFLSHDRERRSAIKRGGATFINSLDLEAGEQRYARYLADDQTPEDVYERRWAITVLDRGLERLGRESAESPTNDHYEQLRRYLTSKEPQVPYREMANAIGMNEGSVKVAVHRLRKRYGKCLRAEIADTVVDPADIDDEVHHLLTSLRPKPVAGM